MRAMYQVQDTILAPNLLLTACICVVSISFSMRCKSRTESKTEITAFGPLQAQRDENLILQHPKLRTPIPKIAVNVTVERGGS